MKIEAIFGGILALFVVALGAAALFAGGGKSYGNDRTPVADAVAGAAVHPLDVLRAERTSSRDKICVCLREGRAYGAQGLGPNSADYATGYSMCRDLAGDSAAEAWTAGFETAGARPLSCNRFLRSVGY